MDGTRKYHADWCNPVKKKVHRWNALTDKWIIVQNLTISKYQFTNKMTLQKEDQSVDASVLSGRGNKTIMRDKVWSRH